jgi:hypothetical protein
VLVADLTCSSNLQSMHSIRRDDVASRFCAGVVRMYRCCSKDLTVVVSCCHTHDRRLALLLLIPCCALQMASLACIYLPCNCCTYHIVRLHLHWCTVNRLLQVASALA